MLKNDLVLDRYSRVVYTCDDLCQMLMNGNDISAIINVEWDEDLEKYNNAVIENYDEYNKLAPLKQLNVSLEEYDSANQSLWFMPEKYSSMDIIAFIKSITPDEEKYRARVEKELTLYDKYSLLDVLKLCVFLTDTFRENKIVCGVGRGSSVASYVLYLIGIHKIDSVKYDLDIREFLK